MPPRLVVKKKPVSSDVVSEDPPVPDKPKKRLMKRVVKKIVTTEPEPVKEPVEEPVKEDTDPLVAYTASLNDFDRMVMEIAKDHLGTSFCLEKSVGFIEFLSNSK